MYTKSDQRGISSVSITRNIAKTETVGNFTTFSEGDSSKARHGFSPDLKASRADLPLRVLVLFPDHMQ